VIITFTNCSACIPFEAAGDPLVVYVQSLRLDSATRLSGKAHLKNR
jgi:hypothetical protein